MMGGEYYWGRASHSGAEQRKAQQKHRDIREEHKIEDGRYGGMFSRKCKGYRFQTKPATTRHCCYCSATNASCHFCFLIHAAFFFSFFFFPSLFLSRLCVIVCFYFVPIMPALFGNCTLLGGWLGKERRTNDASRQIAASYLLDWAEALCVCVYVSNDPYGLVVEGWLVACTSMMIATHAHGLFWKELEIWTYAPAL